MNGFDLFYIMIFGYSLNLVLVSIKCLNFYFYFEFINFTLAFLNNTEA